MKKLFFLMVICGVLFSCKTVNIESRMLNEYGDEETNLRKEVERLKNENDAMKVELEYKIKQEQYEYDIEPIIIPTTTYVVIDRDDIKTKEVDEENKLTGKDAVKQSLKDSIVPLKEYIGGTSIFDYDENVQFPVFTKKLAMTTIILNNDEAMVDTDPFMSDALSWEITGDIWSTDEGDRQIIMLKPKETGLETNMLIVTNKRLYHFVLYSTKSDYQPMVRFRYPTEPKFIKSKKLKENPLNYNTEYSVSDSKYLSFNYEVSVSFFQKKVDWFPEVVYDDGSHTYIRLPEIVLQKEFPGVWEGDTEITNYEIHPTEHNLIIINKLIEKLTLKVGNSKVTIKKKRGNPKNISVNRV